MSVPFVLNLEDRATMEAVANALDVYASQLRASIERTRGNLAAFEKRHGLSTEAFLETLSAEDVAGGDLEYVAWAGEAHVRDGLLAELDHLERARGKLP